MASKAFGKFSPAKPHLVHGPGGIANEIETLRQQIDEAFSSIEAENQGEVFASVLGLIPIEGADDDGIVTSKASVVAGASYTAAGNTLDGILAHGAAGPAIVKCPKRVTITIGGTGADWAGGVVAIVGTDADGNAQSENITTAAGAAVTTGTKYFATVTSASYGSGVATGTGATVKVGAAAEVACIMNGASALTSQTLTGNSVFNRNRIGNREMPGSPLPLARKLIVIFSASANWTGGTMTVSGLDANGDAISENFTPGNGATRNGVKYFKQVTQVTITAQGGTAGTFTIGIADTTVGLPVKKLDGAIAAVGVKELTRADSTVAWTAAVAGTVTDAASALPNGAYTPNTAPDGASERLLAYIAAP